MLINCTTKGCLQQTDAKLDRDTREVICENCGNPINGITDMMKRSMDSFGQVLRNRKVQPFQQYCMHCKASRSLYVKGNEAFCQDCNTKIFVTPSFLQGLKSHLESKKKYEAVGVE